MDENTHKMVPFNLGDLVIVDDKTDEHYDRVARVEMYDLETGEILVKFVTDGVAAIYRDDQLVPRA